MQVVNCHLLGSKWGITNEDVIRWSSKIWDTCSHIYVAYIFEITFASFKIQALLIGWEWSFGGRGIGWGRMKGGELLPKEQKLSTPQPNYVILPIHIYPEKYYFLIVTWTFSKESFTNNNKSKWSNTSIIFFIPSLSLCDRFLEIMI